MLFNKASYCADKSFLFLIEVIALFMAFSIMLLPISVSSSETNSLKDYSTNVLKMQMKEKKMRSILNEIVDEISNDCCEDNFEDKKQVLEIKTDLINCLNSEDTKCLKGFLVYI